RALPFRGQAPAPGRRDHLATPRRRLSSGPRYRRSDRGRRLSNRELRPVLLHPVAALASGPPHPGHRPAAVGASARDGEAPSSGTSRLEAQSSRLSCPQQQGTVCVANPSGELVGCIYPPRRGVALDTAGWGHPRLDAAVGAAPPSLALTLWQADCPVA